MTTVVHLTTVHNATDNRIAAKECAAASEAGYNVTLVAPLGPNGSSAFPHHHALPGRTSRASRLVLGYVNAWSALRSLNPQILHIHDPELIPLAVAWGAVHDTATIYDAHEDLPLQVSRAKHYIPRVLRKPVQLLARGLELTADRWMDAIVVATPRLAKNYSNTRVTLVQNFPWLSSFGPVTDYPSGGKAFAYVGVIAEDRGRAMMLDCISDNSMPDVSLITAGRFAGSEDAGAVHDASRVEYRGIIEPANIGELVGACVAGFAILKPLPNYLEAQSTKIYEYMAAGRPFICSNFPAWTEQLESLRAGILVDPENRHAVVAAMACLLSDPEEASKMGRRGRAAIESQFNFAVESTKLIQLYADLS